MGRPYAKGYRCEREAKAFLEKQGFFVVRSAGSHSPADLVAIRYREVWLVQVKAKTLPSKAEREKLLNIATMYGATAVAMFKQNRRWCVKIISGDNKGDSKDGSS